MIGNKPGLVVNYASAPSRNRGPLGRMLRLGFFTASGSLILLLTLRAAAAMYFDVRIAWLRLPLALLNLLAVGMIWLLIKARYAGGLTAGTFALVLGWWLTLRPSNERDWQPDLAVLPYATTNRSQITLHNIRNCDYPNRALSLARR